MSENDGFTKTEEWLMNITKALMIELADRDYNDSWDWKEFPPDEHSIGFSWFDMKRAKEYDLEYSQHRPAIPIRPPGATRPVAWEDTTTRTRTMLTIRRKK